MLSLIKRLLEEKQQSISGVTKHQLHDTRIIEETYRDGSTKYKVEAYTDRNYGGSYCASKDTHWQWRAIHFHGDGKVMETDGTPFVWNHSPTKTDKKEIACLVVKNYKKYWDNKTLVSTAVVECCEPRVINKE